MGVFLLYLGVMIILCTFILSLNRLLNCLIVIENLNILIIYVMLLEQVDQVRVAFLVLIVMFTIEAAIGLILLTRLWCSSSAIGILGR